MNDRLLVTGVYCIRNKINSKVYVGSAAKTLRGRLRQHLAALRSGRHHNCHLQASWNKYGAGAFQFFILERCSAVVCIEREQYWIDLFDAANPKVGYNKAPRAGNLLGFVHSAESREKTRLRAIGRVPTKEGKQNMSVSGAMRWANNAERARMILIHKMRSLREADKAQLLEMSARAGRVLRGKVRSGEERHSISAGTKRAMADPELRQRLKDASKRRWDRWRREKGIEV